MTLALRDGLQPLEQSSQSRGQISPWRQLLVSACFSGGCSTRLLGVTCCLAQRDQARWKDVGGGVCVPCIGDRMVPGVSGKG